MDAPFTGIAFAQPDSAEITLAGIAITLPRDLWLKLPALLAQLPDPDSSLNYLERIPPRRSARRHASQHRIRAAISQQESPRAPASAHNFQLQPLSQRHASSPAGINSLARSPRKHPRRHHRSHEAPRRLARRIRALCRYRVRSSSCADPRPIQTPRIFAHHFA